MKLSDEQKEQAVTWLNEKWKPVKKCTVCGSTSWSVSDTFFQLTEFHLNKIIVGGPVQPVICVTCNNCGNTILINAVLSGIIPTPENEIKK